jgi:hypothetical protein
MLYRLHGYSAGSNRFIEITEEEHDRLKRAMDALLRLLGVEEKFDMLAENYDELEAAIESAARRSVVFGRTGWGSDVANIHTVNRRLNNFMSSARLYLDQVDHDLSQLFGSQSGVRDLFNVSRSHEYDARLGYRALEALRNYAQHRDIPVHGLSFGSKRKEEGGQGFVEHTIRVTLKLDRLREEGGFKETVLAELEATGTEADLKPLVRDYMTGLQAVHTAVRRAVASDEPGWVNEISSAKSRTCTDLGDAGAKLYNVIRRTDDDEWAGSTPVFDEFLPRLRELRQKNAAVRDLTRQLRSS